LIYGSGGDERNSKTGDSLCHGQLFIRFYNLNRRNRRRRGGRNANIFQGEIVDPGKVDLIFKDVGELDIGIVGVSANIGQVAAGYLSRRLANLRQILRGRGMWVRHRDRRSRLLRCCCLEVPQASVIHPVLEEQ